MDRMKSLQNKSITQFTICLIGILLLAAPLFYVITEKYYAEELEDILECVRSQHPIGKLDLQRDIMVGILIQYGLIAVILGVSVIFTLRFITRRLWKPFDDTLQKIENFHLGHDCIPKFEKTDIKEFERLNNSISDLIKRDINSYQVQKEFTENASHELQTPIAIIRSNLDLLLQEELNEEEYSLVQNMYDVTTRLGRLNRSLLLLAKIENNQYEDAEEVDVTLFIKDSIPQYNNIYSETINFNGDQENHLLIRANRILLEVLINNLVVNALRHNVEGEAVNIVCKDKSLSVINKAIDGALNSRNMFNRFNNPHRSQKGNGLGLAIVKEICDYYHWQIYYSYSNNEHCFFVEFK